MTRRAVALLATARASTVDGVDGVSATVGARKVALTVRTPSEQRGDIEHQVQSRVSEALQATGLSPAPAVTVTVRTHRP